MNSQYEHRMNKYRKCKPEKVLSCVTFFFLKSLSVCLIRIFWPPSSFLWPVTCVVISKIRRRKKGRKRGFGPITTRRFAQERFYCTTERKREKSCFLTFIYALEVMTLWAELFSQISYRRKLFIFML